MLTAATIMQQLQEPMAAPRLVSADLQAAPVVSPVEDGLRDLVTPGAVGLVTPSLTPQKGEGYADLPLPLQPLSIAIGDWDELFRAVEAKLTETVGGVTAKFEKPEAMRPVDVPVRVHAMVLECVGALDKLHRALRHERGIRKQLEMQASNPGMNPYSRKLASG